MEELRERLKVYQTIVNQLRLCQSASERCRYLVELPTVQSFFKKNPNLNFYLTKIDPLSQSLILQIIAVGEGEIVLRGVETGKEGKLESLCEILKPVETFYDSIGGIAGYHLEVLKLLEESEKSKSRFSENETILEPLMIDVTRPDEKTRQIVRWGIESLKEIGEIYPVGGAGDRLSLKDPESGDDLPAACLRFQGRTLLSLLVRDLQAREYVYYKLYGKPLLTPIALMTSQEKNNHQHILDICEENKWFGRPKESFRLFIQPLVPVMTQEGHWAINETFDLILKPGGHGVIWKLAQDNGVFDWFKSQGRDKAIVRQINNPVAGTDYGLLALAGIGTHENKSIGFASCPRRLHSPEGMNVVIEKKVREGFEYRTTNIEYTEFKKLGVKDEPVTDRSPYSLYPSNTNILFVNVDDIQKAISRSPLPGKIINMKNNIETIDEKGHLKNIKAGRLETMMQNIADEIKDFKRERLEKAGSLSSFVTFNKRRKIISVTKKLHKKGELFFDTPEGCLYDYLNNIRELLVDKCHMILPELDDPETYLEKGPNIHVMLHPALGPLYSIIAQKIRGGQIKSGSELHLECAEVDIESLNLSGSLLITALDILGQNGTGPYSEDSGKCQLKNVTVENKGINRRITKKYWQNVIKRDEALKIVLHGNAELFAENITFKKDSLIEVPANQRWIAFEKNGVIDFHKETLDEPSWQWNYDFDAKENIILTKK